MPDVAPVTAPVFASMTATVALVDAHVPPEVELYIVVTSPIQIKPGPTIDEGAGLTVSVVVV